MPRYVIETQRVITVIIPCGKWKRKVLFPPWKFFLPTWTIHISMDFFFVSFYSLFIFLPFFFNIHYSKNWKVKFSLYYKLKERKGKKCNGFDRYNDFFGSEKFWRWKREKREEIIDIWSWEGGAITICQRRKMRETRSQGALSRCRRKRATHAVISCASLFNRIWRGETRSGNLEIYRRIHACPLPRQTSEILLIVSKRVSHRSPRINSIHCYSIRFPPFKTQTHFFIVSD